MTREDKILIEYENIGIPLEASLNIENGWLKIKPNQHRSKYEKLDLLKLTSLTHSIRPKTLKGIEDNNGWVKIKDALTLPKKGRIFWVMKKGYDYPIIERLYENDSLYWLDLFTHYKAIEIPNNPLY